MPVYQLTRFEVRPDAIVDAERAMHDYASWVRRELPDSSWTSYRDPGAPTRYTTFLRAEDAAAAKRHREATGTLAFLDALRALLVGDIDEAECQLVTSSDLAPRPRPDRPRARPDRPRPRPDRQRRR